MDEKEAAFLQTNEVSVGYHETPLIKKLALSVSNGQIVTLIGPNGAGKSTIIKSIIRQLKLIEGVVWLGGADMSHLSNQEIAKQVAVVMTQKIQSELMTCRQVVAMGRYPYTGRFGILSKQDWKIVEDALDMVGIQEQKERLFDELSDGQKQMVLLARAICQNPKLLVLDEPTSFLDVRHKMDFLRVVRTLVKERNMAVLLSLHELDLVQKISDQVVCVRGEHIFACGTPEAIFESDTIARLYDLSAVDYMNHYGTLELSMPQQDEPARVLVLCGGGSGIATFRKLQREGVSFVAGVLSENDQDYPVAKALAKEVISVKLFEPIDSATLELAKQRMKTCSKVICTLTQFGTLNAWNHELLAYARELGLEVFQPR